MSHKLLKLAKALFPSIDFVASVMTTPWSAPASTSPAVFLVEGETVRDDTTTPWKIFIGPYGRWALDASADLPFINDLLTGSYPRVVVPSTKDHCQRLRFPLAPPAYRYQAVAGPDFANFEHLGMFDYRQSRRFIGMSMAEPEAIILGGAGFFGWRFHDSLSAFASPELYPFMLYAEFPLGTNTRGFHRVTSVVAWEFRWWTLKVFHTQPSSPPADVALMEKIFVSFVGETPDHVCAAHSAACHCTEPKKGPCYV